MNLRPRPPAPPELNLTPLVDVVFLLLLFFMISTTFVRERELPIRLPEAEGQPAAQTLSDVLVVGIDRDSQYLVDGLPVTASAGLSLSEALEQALHTAMDAALGRTLRIEADAETPHQAVMRVLDLAARLGLTQLSFATIQVPPDQQQPASGARSAMGNEQQHEPTAD